MIIIQIVLALLAFGVTPVIVLLYTVQSNHGYYKLGAAIVLLAYAFLLLGIYISLPKVFIVFAILFILHHQTYLHCQKCVDAKKGRRHIVGKIAHKNKKFVIHIIISLWPLYLVQKLPFPVKAKIKTKGHKIDFKNLAAELLRLGEQADADISTNKAEVSFKII